MKNCPYCAEEIQDAAIVCKHCGRDFGEKKASRKRGWWTPGRIVLLAALALMSWGVLSRASGRTELAAAINAPLTVKAEIENVPAGSWKAVALSLPYAGNLDVSLEVVNGNPLDVFLTTPDQLEAMKNRQWDQVRVYSDFNATKTKALHRTAMLSPGNYYLVLRDTSLGILSARASDVAIKANLAP
jgi:hypothetical protein